MFLNETKKVFNPFLKQVLVFTCLQYNSFENTVGKGEIARNEQFLLFPQRFLLLLRNVLPFSSNLKLSYANSFCLEESKICRLEKGQEWLMNTDSGHLRLALYHTTVFFFLDWAKFKAFSDDKLLSMVTSNRRFLYVFTKSLVNYTYSRIKLCSILFYA